MKLYHYDPIANRRWFGPIGVKRDEIRVHLKRGIILIAWLTTIDPKTAAKDPDPDPMTHPTHPK